MTEENVEMSDLEIVVGIVSPLLDADAETSFEDMAFAVIAKGYTFDKAGRLVKSALETLGLRMSRKDRFSAVEDLLAQANFAPTDWSEVDSIASAIADEIDDTTKGQVITAIKTYAKQNKITLPEKPKGKGGGGSRGGIFDKFHDWAIANPAASGDEVKAFIVAQEVTEKQVPKYESLFGGELAFARRFAEAHA